MREATTGRSCEHQRLRRECATLRGQAAFTIQAESNCLVKCSVIRASLVRVDVWKTTPRSCKTTPWSILATAPWSILATAAPLGMAKSFEELVKEGSDQGLDRPKAEARARDLFYGDPPPQAPAVAPEAFASDDELWTFLQATWESRSTGAELVDVLESINDLLDRGVISQEQFREVMRRTKEQQKEPTLLLTEKQKQQKQPKKAARTATSSSAAPAPASAAGDASASAADDARASAEALARSVLLVQRVIRGWSGREKYAWDTVVCARGEAGRGEGGGLLALASKMVRGTSLFFGGAHSLRWSRIRSACNLGKLTGCLQPGLMNE